MKYEIIDHGYEHAQYFQGCGTAFTNFDGCATGIGDSAAEAYADAVEQVYQQYSGAGSLGLPLRPRGIRKRDRVPARLLREPDSEFYWYVSIRYRTH